MTDTSDRAGRGGPSPEELGNIWGTLSDLMRARLSEAAWRSSFADSRVVTLDGDELVIAVPSRPVRDRLVDRHMGALEQALRDIGQPYRVRVVVDNEPRPAVDEHPWQPTLPYDEATVAPDTAPTGPAPAPDGNGRRSDGPRLNPSYTFETFVIGSSNRFAHAAALRVAETPGRSYNPLFIYGAAGLGKTHLLQAIAAYLRDNYPAYAVCYVTTEQFMNDFVDAIRTSRMPSFKHRYRGYDVLLIDDIQFLEGKEGLQEELFHTFEAFYGAERQMVFSSDRPPDAIPTLEERLKSRFRWGLITDIQPPDLETRLAILRQKAAREQHPVPEDVLEYIATHISDNIRHLEGALVRVTAHANLFKEEITVDRLPAILGDMLTDTDRPVQVDTIVDVVADHYGFDPGEIIGRGRRRPLVEARQVAMYLARTMTNKSYPEIGRLFDGRDHSTIIHAVERVEEQMKARQHVYHVISTLQQRIRNLG